MGTFTCRCGHILSTSRESSPYEASFVPDKSLAKLDEAILAQLNSLVTAIESGKTIAQWLAVTDSSQEVVQALLVYRVWGELYFEVRRSMYQCTVCSRIYLETSTPSHFQSFLPEAEGAQAILDAGS